MCCAPDISIIIVNWNTRELLRSCLRSVFSGLGTLEAEILVVDNDSEDGSADMVAKCFPRVRLIRNDTNRGFAAANNQALNIARGRYLLLLNSDTEIRGEVLSASCKYLDEREEVGVLGVRVLNPDGSLQPTCFRDPSLLNLLLYAWGLHRLPWPKWCGRERMRHWDRDDEREVEVVTGCFLLARRRASVEVGLLDEQFFFYGEEADWCRRFRQANWQVRFAPVGEIFHHGGASTERLGERRRLMLARAQVRYLRKYGGFPASVLGGFLLGSAVVLRSVRGLRILRREPWRFIRGLRRDWPRRDSSLIPHFEEGETRGEMRRRAA